LWRFDAVGHARVGSGEKEGFPEANNESCDERVKKKKERIMEG
jgi:hypothetical protein